MILLACLAVTARTGAMQGPPAQAPANAPTTTATVPPNPGAFSNAPREPQRLSSEQQAQHSMLTDREQLLSYAILLFSNAVLFVQYLLLRTPKRNSYEILQLLAIKIRQREGVTLDVIKKEMKDITGDSLERRVATSLAAALGATVETRRQAVDDETPASWRRVAVADGVELHVRDDSPSSREEALVAMREAVRAALGREDIR